MDMNLLFSIGLFDLFPQPVLFLQNTVIAGCNAAARGLGLSPGDAAPELPNLPACAQPRADQPEITSVFPGPQIEQTEAAVSACPSQMRSLETADPSSPVPRSSQPKTIPSSPVTQMVQVFLAGKLRDVTQLGGCSDILRIQASFWGDSLCADCFACGPVRIVCDQRVRADTRQVFHVLFVVHCPILDGQIVRVGVADDRRGAEIDAKAR